MWAARKEFALESAVDAVESRYATASAYFSTVVVAGEGDAVPSHWPDPHPGSAPLPRRLLVEYFVVGLSDGQVEIFDISAAAVAGSGAPFRRVNLTAHVHCRAVESGMELGERQVLDIALCGSLAASVSAREVRLCGVFPSFTLVGSQLPPAGAADFESVCLWEGRRAWAESLDGEEGFVYVACGTSLGTVMLYAVDVVASQRPWVILAVFATAVVGGDGLKDPVPHLAQRGTSSKPLATPFRCLAFWGDGVLCVGTDKYAVWWDLCRVPPRGDSAPSARRRAQLRLNGADGEAAAEALRGATVFVPHSYDDLVALAPAARAKHGAVCCDQRLVGTILAADGPQWQVTFPELRRDVQWPAAAFELCNLQSCVTRADDRGAVRAIAPVSGRLLVTGGDDGAVRLWGWQEGMAVLFRRIASGHRDTLRTIAVTVPGLGFLTGSLDGSFREWRAVAEAGEASTAVCIATTQCGGTEREPFGVRTAMPVGPGAAAVLLLFQMKIRTFAYLAVATCEPPPEMIFDGERTIPLPPLADEAASVDDALAAAVVK